MKLSINRRGIMMLAGFVALMAAQSSQSGAAPGWQWYKTDTHTHSTVSADAYVDIGIHSKKAKDAGYSALFLTDHNGASSFQVNNLNANHMAFEDALTRWTIGTFGTLSSSTNALVSTPVNTGSSSLHLRAVANGSAETNIWATRGPSFRSGDIILRVSIYPVQIDAGSGVYVSASIGGDPRVIAAPYGYTTQAGVISPGKTTVLVWQLGTPRAASSDPNARVLTYSLGSYTLNAWNHYVINISNALNDIPAADRPLDYNGLTYLKMAAAANGGTAEAYFDTYSVDASAPELPANEYINRTAVVGLYDTSTFKIFPAYEMGQQKHTNRFNFGITDPADYRSYTYGSDGIAEVQQLGYPAQANHPGTTITTQEAIDTQAHGADLLEVRQAAWITVWDAILQQGAQIVGIWSSDSHVGVTTSSGASYIYAPALDFDELLHSLFEGLSYNAIGNFAGRIIINQTAGSQEPYPARYPTYVSAALASANVHVAVTGGMKNGKVNWYRNGILLATDTNPSSASTYDAVKTILLDGAFTYVRADALSSSGSLKALSQALFFVDVPGLPLDKRFHVERITTTDGRGYNKLLTKGITAATWNAVDQSLSLTLENRIGSLVTMHMDTTGGPQNVRVDGAVIAAAGTQAAFDAATDSTWYYDGAAQRLYLKARHAGTNAGVTVEFSGTPQPTSTPTNTPTPDPAATATPTPLPTNTPTNTPLPTATPTATATPTITPTPTATPLVSTFTFTPVADTYVNGSLPTTNYGNSTTLRADASPDLHAYLRFTVSGLSNPVTRATLRIYANSTSSIGYDVRAVSDNTWVESTMTYNDAPPVGNQLASSGAISAGAWATIDITPYITGNGTFNLALTTTSNSSMSLASRETGANAPQLVVETALAATPTATPTPDPAATPTNTPTATPTVTPLPTSTPTATATNTPLPTNTPTVTTTPDAPATPTNTPLPTATPTATPTPTVTPMPTNTPLPTATPTVTPTPTATPVVSAFTFTPIADTYVNASLPTSNFGTSTILRADASPDLHSYLRFTVSGLSAPVTRATLRVLANSTSSIGYEVRAVSDNLWSEGSMTYNDAPPVGNLLGSSGAFSAGAWTTVDVTAYITGNGTFNLALTTTSATAMSLASRESGANAPQLVVETAP